MAYDYPKQRTFRVENKSEFVKEGNKAPLKYRDMLLTGLGLKPESFTTGGMAQADSVAMKKLAGKNPSKGEYGDAYDHFKAKGEEEFGKQMCLALDSWLRFKGIEKLLSTYITPL